MPRLTKSLFIALLLLLSPMAEARDVCRMIFSDTVDRNVMFQETYKNLAAIIDLTATRPNKKHWDLEDKFRKMLSNNVSYWSSYYVRYKAELSFVKTSKYDDWFFRLEEGQPARTAKTDSEPDRPIYINERLISNRTNKFNLLDVTQLLLHEFGHKIPGVAEGGKTKPEHQRPIDDFAADVVSDLQKYYRAIKIDDNTSLEILSIPYKPHLGEHRPELENSGFIAILNDQYGSVDVSRQIADYIGKNVLMTDQPFHKLFTALGHLEWTNESVEVDSKTGIAKLRATISARDHIVNIEKKDYRRYEPSLFKGPLKDTFDVEFAIETRGAAKILRMARAQHYPADESGQTVALTSTKVDESTLRVSSTASGALSSKVRSLLVRAGDRDLEIPIKSTNDLTDEFEVKIPRVSAVDKISISAVVLEDGSRVSSENQLRFNLASRFKGQHRSPVEFVAAEVEGYDGFKSPTSQDSAALRVDSAKMRMMVRATEPIREVRIRIEKFMREYDHDDFTRPILHDVMSMSEKQHLYPQKQSQYTSKSSDWVVLRENEFSQRQVGDLLQIEFNLKTKMEDRLSVDYSRITQRYSRFLKIDKRIQFLKHVGIDTGERNINLIEFTTESLDTSVITPDNPIEMQITRPPRPLSNYSDSFQ